MNSLHKKQGFKKANADSSCPKTPLDLPPLNTYPSHSTVDNYVNILSQTENGRWLLVTH